MTTYNWSKRLQEEREKRGGKCQVDGCRVEDGLEFAHIKPTGLSGEGRGQSRRAIDIIRNPECYLLMCRPHHKKFDSDYWIDKVEN